MWYVDMFSKIRVIGSSLGPVTSWACDQVSITRLETPSSGTCLPLRFNLLAPVFWGKHCPPVQDICVEAPSNFKFYL